MNGRASSGPAPDARRRHLPRGGRGLPLLLVVTALSGAPRPGQADGRPALYVFLPTNAKTAALEAALQAKLPGLAVTAFSRSRDFQDAMASKKPEAILALEPVLAGQSLTPTLRGTSHGEDTEAYVLLSANAPLVGTLSNRTLGVVDMLGRAETQRFVAALVKAPDVKTKLVTKLEDLLSLLQFGAADAALVPVGALAAFKERSRMTLSIRELEGARVGRAAVAVLAPGAAAIVSAQIKALDAATNQMLGVDSWSAR
jgi:hypothetical protein